SPASLVNTIVGQEFQLLRVLVQGGSAYIYLGQSVKDNSYVAVKALVKPESDHDMQLLQIEIDIHSSFNHSNIVSLHRVFEDDNYFYLVMELCDQGDLFDYLFAGHESSTPHELIAKQMFSQVLDSVEHMHANSVFHRDLKLENIFLKSHGEHHVVCKVGDFGLSTRERTSTDFGCGSASYLPPEQLKRDRPYDCAASDVWSLGIVLLLLMFGGDYPWQTATDDDSSFVEFKRDSSVLKKRLYPGLSSATCRLLESMLAMDGADRPSVSEIKKQFSVIDHFYADGKDNYYSKDNYRILNNFLF
ncbi:hypothetical protein MUCCIDRAFT_148930, partial [Mucor lusitanicus CBS 277.49]